MRKNIEPNKQFYRKWDVFIFEYIRQADPWFRMLRLREIGHYPVLSDAEAEEKYHKDPKFHKWIDNIIHKMQLTEVQALSPAEIYENLVRIQNQGQRLAWDLRHTYVFSIQKYFCDLNSEELRTFSAEFAHQPEFYPRLADMIKKLFPRNQIKKKKKSINQGLTVSEK